MKKLNLFVSICILAILLVVAACKPKYPASETFVTITSTQLDRFIRVTNDISTMRDEIIVDETYAVPTIKWIKESYTPQLQKFLFDNQLRTYTSIENDCDDYALYGASIGHIMHRHAIQKPKGSTLTIGEFIYSADSMNGSAHAINFFVATDENNKLVLVFYEPQTQLIKKLDKDKIIVLTWKM